MQQAIILTGEITPDRAKEVTNEWAAEWAKTGKVISVLVPAKGEFKGMSIFVSPHPEEDAELAEVIKDAVNKYLTSK